MRPNLEKGLVGLETPRTIAVFLPKPLGDAIMVTPALRAMREHFPQARITFVGSRTSLDVLAGTNMADDEIIDITAGRGGWPFGKFLTMASQLRKRRFDLAVVFPNSFRSALLAWAGGAKQRVGYSRKDKRGWLLTKAVPAPRDESGELVEMPTLDYYIDLVRELGVECRSRLMELAVPPQDAAAADRLLAEAGVSRDRPIVVLNPGAAFGPSKLWPAERYAAVADELARRRGASIIINSAPNEADIARQVAAGMKNAPAINFAERAGSVPLIKAIMAVSDLLITNDTGARHIAAAMGIGVVTIFGSTNPVRAEIDYPREIKLRVAVPCSPCQQKQCPNPPGEEHMQCMTAVTVEMVLEAAEKLLDSRGLQGE